MSGQEHIIDEPGVGPDAFVGELMTAHFNERGTEYFAGNTWHIQRR
ncbi:Unknown protein sequence [Pseudomonas syringae pv. maculicola]|nr:Unknown protein sequence [Pseudomonas syringae pv. maculicola]